MTVADLRPWSTAATNADVAFDIDTARFFELFRQRVLSHA
jgi:hypothetical protein